MIKCCAVTVALSGALLGVRARDQSSRGSAHAVASDAEIRMAVLNLRAETWDQSIEIFYSRPEEATKILISDLKPIKRERYPNGHHPHAVLIVRALRSLTGVDFRATTAVDLSSDEAHFLDLDAKGEIKFFGTWMSRDADWVAPKDAQIAIIKKWQTWFALHGHGYKYVNDRDFDDWYF